MGRPLGRALGWAWLASFLACDFNAGTGVLLQAVELGVVLNASPDPSLSIFPSAPEGPPVEIPLGPGGSPVALAVRGRLAAVSLETASAVAVVDLVDHALVHTVALSEGSAPAGAAFINDSIVLVADTRRSSVTPVNARRGTRAADVPVGRHPVDVVVGRTPGCQSPVCTRVIVVNAGLDEDLRPAGPSTVTVLRNDLSLLAEIPLSGENAVAAATDPDGFLHVLHAGRPGTAGGSLSVVSLTGLVEVSHHTGFGESPGDVAVMPDRRVLVAALTYGVAVWDRSTSAFLRAPADAVAPAGVGSVGGLGQDGDGRIWSLRPDCPGPGAALRLTPSLEVERTVATGACPVELGFVLVPRD